MTSENEKIYLIAQMSRDINEVKDLDLLLERILSYARKFFNADAGSIYLKEKDKLTFSYTQNETLQVRLGPGKKLVYSTFKIPIGNRSIAGYVAATRRSLNIPDVYAMSGSEPYAFDSHFDELSKYRTQSMLTVPMLNQRDDLLGVMQIINAKDQDGIAIPFSKVDESLIRHFASSAALSIERAQMTRDIILRMISMAELRDPKETGPHVNRVASYSTEIYEEWCRNNGIPLEEMEQRKDVLRMAAMLHDVGKVAISDLILQKPARLTKDEFEIMKSHTYLGARLFREPHSDFDDMAATVALSHHEKWDGTGYPGYIDIATAAPFPGGCSGGTPMPRKAEEIPLPGRIVAVADVYDALSSRRVYKEAWTEERVQEEMQAGAGTHFDPSVIDAFFGCLDMLRSIRERYPDEHE
jgi:HD-GYP domain-containing protein (c-di-GMP phosphodiesterase class II)